MQVCNKYKKKDFIVDIRESLFSMELVFGIEFKLLGLCDKFFIY